MPRKRVALGLIGPQLDFGLGAGRWSLWRPTISLCQHEDLLLDRFDLLHQRKFLSLAKQLEADITSVSPETKVVRHEVEFADPWDFEAVYAALHDFAAGYPFDTERADYLLHITTGTHVAQICLFLLAESRHLPARLVQTSPPARKFKSENPGEFRIIDLDLSKYDRLAQRFVRAQRAGLSFLKAGIDTRNAAFNHLIEEIEHVAGHARDPLLLLGPTGAGKSKLARRIFELKKQRRQFTGRFVEINCATLRGDAAMSTLFGHKRGAFTGAVTDRPGLLREADAGLLFLDEVAELGDDEQAMLLRAIEDKVFLPLGSDREVQSDFQLICGTNCDLPQAVQSGSFRADLLARINLWPFHLPALQARREDIEPNIQYELDQLAARIGIQVRFNREAAQQYLAFATSPAATWPGNFRSLSASITRMATLATAGRITERLVTEEIARLRAQWAPPAPAETAGDDLLLTLLAPDQLAKIDLFDRVQLAAVIEICRRARTLSAAGRELFAASRTHRATPNDADRLRKYLARFNLDWDALTQAP